MCVGGDHDHDDQAGDSAAHLYTHHRLWHEFGPVVRPPEAGQPSFVERDLIGDFYRKVLHETSRVLAYQWSHDVKRSAVKGFLFHGPPGVGKTTLAKRLTYEISNRFREQADGSPARGGVGLVLVDGGDIARGVYGQSEAQIRKVFNFATSSEHRKMILLFDDVESILMARDRTSKEWHFAQNSVFFHHMDDLDTSRAAVILTTNRADLVDGAITDRFMQYAFNSMGADTLVHILEEKALQQGFDPAEIASLKQRLLSSGEESQSVRLVERLVHQAYIEKALSS